MTLDKKPILRLWLPPDLRKAVRHVAVDLECSVEDAAIRILQTGMATGLYGAWYEGDNVVAPAAPVAPAPEDVPAERDEPSLPEDDGYAIPRKEWLALDKRKTAQLCRFCGKGRSSKQHQTCPKRNEYPPHGGLCTDTDGAVEIVHDPTLPTAFEFNRDDANVSWLPIDNVFVVNIPVAGHKHHFKLDGNADFSVLVQGQCGCGAVWSFIEVPRSGLAQRGRIRARTP